MIRLYKPKIDRDDANIETKQNGAYRHVDYGGLCVLEPQTCVVHETASGEYVLTMVHPYDTNGKWRMLAEDYIITAPVPKTEIPKVTIGNLQKWGVYGTNSQGPGLDSTTLTRNVMTAARTENFLYFLIYDPIGSKWNKKKEYKIGDYVLKGTNPIKVYRAKDRPEKGDDPEGTYETSDDNPWEFQQNLNQYTPPVDNAFEIATIPSGEVFYKIADFDFNYMYICRANGQHGFVKTGECENLGAGSTGSRVINAQTIDEQDFRIYKVAYDDKAMTVTVEARHVSYDIRNNSLMHCKVEDETAATAAVQIIGKTAYSFQDYDIICNIDDDDVDADWSFQKPTMAILDPQSGLAGITRAKVYRDNNIFYVLQNTDNDHGYEIRYGGNLLGVNIERDIDDVVTRIMMIADNGTDGKLFFDDIYWTSGQDGNYSSPRIEAMDSEYYVGQEIVKKDGTKRKLSEANVKSKMLKEAKKRFTRDKADRETVTLEVDFLMLGDTEEYKQFKDLQRLQMYDTVKITTGPSNMILTVQMTEYEYDAINRRYNRAVFGTVKKLRRGKIASYMLGTGGVDYSSLAPAVKRKIKGAT